MIGNLSVSDLYSMKDIFFDMAIFFRGRLGLWWDFLITGIYYDSQAAVAGIVKFCTNRILSAGIFCLFDNHGHFKCTLCNLYAPILLNFYNFLSFTGLYHGSLKLILKYFFIIFYYEKTLLLRWSHIYQLC